MRVLFLQQQPCVRALKYAAGLAAHGCEVTLGFAYRGRTLSELYGAGDELFESWWPLGDDPAAALPAILDAFDPDVIHSHNLPDELTVLALDATNGNIPVVHDFHDMQSLRRTPYEDGYPEPAGPLTLERRAAQESTAVVAISAEMVEALQARYRLPERVVAYANYALARDLPAVAAPAPHPGRARIVYQGTLSDNGGHYDLRELFAALAAQGLSLDVYPSREAPLDYHAIPGIRMRATLPSAQLLTDLAGYDFGWAGFNDAVNGPHLDTALPNKLYEYLGCGLPVLTLRHRALRRMLSDEGVGLALDRVDDVGAALAEADASALRARVAAARERFTVEHQIHRIAALYCEVAGAAAHGAPARR